MTETVRTQICHLTINAANLDRSAQLYSHGLAADTIPVSPNSSGYYRKLWLGGAALQRTRLLLQRPLRMPQPDGTGFDIASADPYVTASRFVAAGAHMLGTNRDGEPRVQDYDGNEFTILHRAGNGIIATLARLTLPAHDPDRAATFWQSVCNPQTVTTEPNMTVLHRPNDLDIALYYAPDYEFPDADPRVHVDFEAGKGAVSESGEMASGVDEAVAIFLDRGASWVREQRERGFAFAVLADPSGNRFCILEPEFPHELERDGLVVAS